MRTHAEIATILGCRRIHGATPAPCERTLCGRWLLQDRRHGHYRHPDARATWARHRPLPPLRVACVLRLVSCRACLNAYRKGRLLRRPA